MTFSYCADQTCRKRITDVGRPQILLIGIETHVCVQQTALDLLRMQMQPVILTDAVSSRRPHDREIALHRMRAAGAVVTTVESALFELVHESGTDRFKKILPLVR
jgi:nicotinamidase-related amidase